MTSVVLTSRLPTLLNESTDLAARIPRGDQDAFDQLIRLYSSRVARLAHRLLGWEGEVDDVVQDVFVAAFRNAGKFKAKSSLWTWLTVITLNRCRSHHRRQKVIRRVMGFLRAGRADQSEAADRESLSDETSREVRKAIGALKTIHREVIVLFYLEHKPIGEIARVVGASPATVDVRLHRARAKLRTALKSFQEGSDHGTRSPE